MGTVRQNRANQLNAQRSTGPKSQSGKEHVRSNALKHGLSGQGVALFPDEAEAVARRAAEWNSSLRPHNPYEFWLAEQIALESLRIERCQERERNLRELAAERAALCWDEDRSLAAELLATRLGTKPALVSGQLRQTKQGCALLLDRWAGLEAELLGGQDWDEAQRALALDLLGTPPELRTGPTAVDAPAGVSDVGALRREMVRAEIEALEQLRAEVLDGLDEFEQDAAVRGLPVEPDRAITLVRRYEAACLRRLQWAMSQLKAGRHANSPAPVPEPASAPPSSPVMPAGVQAPPVVQVPQTEAPPGGSSRSEAALEVEPHEAARVELEAESETREAARVELESAAEVPAEALPGRDDAPSSGPALKGLMPMIATGVPSSLADGISDRTKGNRRARRAAEARRRRARR